ncbi:hypothetical protein ABIG07_000808 [Bradyrhizobium ottawaense]|uniref:Uncharacterized protein n=1 Tax=Bradyrhizobium ottawaense TaxID=931866 RepID=A0ABV4FJW6_9BRAD
MRAHRFARGLRIMRRDRLAHGAMLVERGAPGARALEIMRELREIGIEALVEQLADDAHQNGIAEAAGDRDVERAVMHHRGFAGMLDILHCEERGVDAGDVVFGRDARGLFGDGAFEEFAGAQQLERALDDGGGCGRGDGSGLDHIDAGADADAQASLDLERNQGFAHGRPGHLELLGELALGRQAAADRVLAAVDQASQLIGDLAIEPSRLHSFQRHAGPPERVARGISTRGPPILENWSYQLTGALT